MTERIEFTHGENKLINLAIFCKLFHENRSKELGVMVFNVIPYIVILFDKMGVYHTILALTESKEAI